MSGSVFPPQPPEAARALTNRIAEHLGIAATSEAFAGVAPGALVEAQVAATSRPDEAAADPVSGGLSFAPLVDGDVVPEAPMRAIAAGAGATLPLLIGTTSEEFNAMSKMAAIDDERAERRLRRLGLDDAGVAAYRASGADAAEQLGQAVTDRTFRLPALRVAEARAGGPAPTFHYEFQWRSPALGGIGAVHCLDLPFVFDVLDDNHAQVVAGDTPTQELADRMHAAWVAFVTDGRPGLAAVPPRRAGDDGLRRDLQGGR